MGPNWHYRNGVLVLDRVVFVSEKGSSDLSGGGLHEFHGFFVSVLRRGGFESLRDEELSPDRLLGRD